MAMNGNHRKRHDPASTTRVDRQALEQALLDELAEFRAAPRSALRPDAHIVDQVVLDSLEIVELAVRIEERWGVSLRAEDVDNLNTIGDLSEAIASRAHRSRARPDVRSEAPTHDRSCGAPPAYTRSQPIRDRGTLPGD